MVVAVQNLSSFKIPVSVFHVSVLVRRVYNSFLPPSIIKGLSLYCIYPSQEWFLLQRLTILHFKKLWLYGMQSSVVKG